MTPGWYRGLVFISIALALASCEPMVDARGHSGDDEDLKQIVTGQTTSEDVMALLGSPTTASNFGDETWYYITQRQERVGIFAPEVTEQRVIAITFAADKTVSGIEHYSREDGKKVQLVKKTTPTEGHDLTVVEQLLGNLGRFNSPGGRSSISPNPRGVGR